MTATDPSPSADSRRADSPGADSPGAGSVVVLQVEGMHCGSCVALIEETLGEQVGVTSATVDLDAARAVVGFDPSQVGVDVLTAAVAEAGYVATPVG